MLYLCVDEPDSGEYKVLPWKATKDEIKQWLQNAGFSRCVDKLSLYSGEELYEMSQGHLRDLCGFSEGVRLYTQLQRDKAQVCNIDLFV